MFHDDERRTQRTKTRVKIWRSEDGGDEGRRKKLSREGGTRVTSALAVNPTRKVDEAERESARKPSALPLQLFTLLASNLFLHLPGFVQPC